MSFVLVGVTCETKVQKQDRYGS